MINISAPTSRVRKGWQSWRGVAFLVVATFAAGGGAQSEGTGAPSDATASPLAAFDWLVGSWRSTDGESTSEEHWLPAAGSIMLGVNRTVVGGETVAFEYIRIESREDGIFYVASPGGGPPTAFRWVESVSGRALFYNAEHDYPRRIFYWREGDELFARIDGGTIDDGEREDAFTWSWLAADSALH